MSYLLQRVQGGTLALSEVADDELRIGRGTRAQLRSENPAVSLEHATIAVDAVGYYVTDLGSITGTYVNGRPVENARLSKGDVIEIGDLRLEVQVADAAKPLFLRVTSRVAARPAVYEEEIAERSIGPRGGVVTAPKIDYVGAYRLARPWLQKLTIVCLVLIAAVLVLREVTLKPEKRDAFMPGGVSSAHTRAQDSNGQPVSKNCAACHDPFHGVTDAKCIGCHAEKQTPHAPAQAFTPRCISCHAEHRGAVRLAMIADVKCTACHAALKTRVTAFGDVHPGFVKPPDVDTLKFNHKLHLQAAGVFNASGRREVLQCTMCHKLVADKNGKLDPRPVSFATDCQRCHRLTFDARFPNAEVPHGGDPGIVYGFLGGIYSGDRDLAGKNPEEVRRILTQRPSMSASQSAVVSAEQVIKAKCATCHVIERVNGRLVASRPAIRARWLAHARFSHTEHRQCETCHAAARQSVPTSDVLLPDKKDCTGCHAAQGGKPASACVTCHEYHERSRQSLASNMSMAPAARGTTPLAGGGTGMMSWIFLAALVLLLIVLLIPVFISMSQRKRTAVAPPQPQPQARPPQAPPPPRQPVQPIAPAPPQQQQVPMMQPAPVKEQTRPEVIPEPQSEGTQMMQWYGMLVCTAGPLEGKRFVIEEEGFYIGRDPALSQVVVPDSRVSKRHVRIVVHDGKVHAIDHDSTNGTFLGAPGGERVTDVILKRGDTLVLADNAAAFKYQI